MDFKSYLYGLVGGACMASFSIMGGGAELPPPPAVPLETVITIEPDIEENQPTGDDQAPDWLTKHFEWLSKEEPSSPNPLFPEEYNNISRRVYGYEIDPDVYVCPEIVYDVDIHNSRVAVGFDPNQFPLTENEYITESSEGINLESINQFFETVSTITATFTTIGYVGAAYAYKRKLKPAADEINDLVDLWKERLHEPEIQEYFDYREKKSSGQLIHLPNKLEPSPICFINAVNLSKGELIDWMESHKEILPEDVRGRCIKMLNILSEIDIDSDFELLLAEYTDFSEFVQEKAEFNIFIPKRDGIEIIYKE